MNFLLRLAGFPTETFDKIVQRNNDNLESIQKIRELTVALDKKERQLDSITSSLLATFNAIPAMVWEKDAEDRFVRVNKTALKFLLLAKKESEVLGKTGIEISDDIIKRGVQYSAGYICGKSDAIVKKKKKVCTFLEDFIVNGTKMYLLVRKASILNKKGTITGTIGVGWDMTDEVKEHQKLWKLFQEKDTENFVKTFKKHVHKYYFSEKDSSLLVLEED